MRWKSWFSAAIIFIVVTACPIQINPTLPPPPCPIADLLLDESLFHGDFSRSAPWPPPMRFGVDKTGVTFSSKTKGGAIQDVYLGSSVKETQRQFTEYTKWEFFPFEGYTEWYTPNSFDYHSAVADQYQFACYRHMASGVETCQAIGQYGPYLIRFAADMSPVLTYQDLDRMLQAIDEKAARCLGK